MQVASGRRSIVNWLSPIAHFQMQCKRPARRWRMRFVSRRVYRRWSVIENFEGEGGEEED